LVPEEQENAPNKCQTFWGHIKIQKRAFLKT
jgi:hypothetical protein